MKVKTISSDNRRNDLPSFAQDSARLTDQPAHFSLGNMLTLQLC